MSAAPVTVLLPGDYLFAEGHARIQTLLGSCVAMVFWHPLRRIGCMCHFVLPWRLCSMQPDARYADEFMRSLMKEVRARRTRPEDYEVRLYGAANMFRMLKTTCADSNQVDGVMLCPGCISVSCRNRVAAHAEAAKHGFVVRDADLGGTAYRHVDFDVATGSVSVKTTPMATFATLTSGT
ncbi:MAG: putative chemoreceptor glutamine deamidase CheD [Pseudomonadota bacterium]|jgi:chemotaxis protein CheD